ncbi:helix-turn-helix transcriptional regulator [Gemmatimonas sp.]|jgi:DNA-binding CsgD family transcriptional regulator|uniref:helix-turn-helix transcriptional regulator n=1 Tax=Gemmatimonas sp. TaxID=1962908 RepID=UPI0037C0FCDB
MSERGESRADWVDPEDDAASNEFRGPLPVAMAGFLLLVVVGGLLDLILDAPDSVWSLHVLFEIGMVVSSLAFAVMLFRGWRRSAATLSRTRLSLEESQRLVVQRQAERDAWRHSAESALVGFSEAINRQFDAWQLTRAERDVALLILKGAGHKQAAAQLERSERTVRQHAVEVYRKAGLQGRAELSAFFLQDLMLP